MSETIEELMQSKEMLNIRLREKDNQLSILQGIVDDLSASQVFVTLNIVSHHR